MNIKQQAILQIAIEVAKYNLDDDDAVTLDLETEIAQTISSLISDGDLEFALEELSKVK